MRRLPETCEDFEAALPLFAGADLEAEEMDAVRRHLDTCASCAAEARRAAAAREVWKDLREAVDAQPFESLWGPVRAQLAAEGRLAGAPPLPVPLTPFRARTLRRIGAVAGLAAAVLLVVFQPGFGPGGDDAAPSNTPLVQGGEPVPAVTVPLEPERPEMGNGMTADAGSRTGSASLAGMGAADPRSAAPARAPQGSEDAVQPLRAATADDVHMIDTAWDVRRGLILPTSADSRASSARFAGNQ